MKVRFGRPVRREASREDGLLMPLGPALRPHRPYWQWYLLLAAAAIPLLLGVMWLLRQLACLP